MICHVSEKERWSIMALNRHFHPVFSKIDKFIHKKDPVIKQDPEYKFFKIILKLFN